MLDCISWDTDVFFGQLEITLNGMKSFEVAYLSVVTSNASWVLDLYVVCGIYYVSFIEEEDRAITFKNIPKKKKKEYSCCRISCLFNMECQSKSHAF